MGRDSIWRLLYRFSGPSIVSMLVSASYNLVDTIFVGRLGPAAVAALSIAFPILMIFMAFGAGTGIGAGSLISRNLGAGKKEEASRVAANTLSLLIILSAVAMAVFLPFLKPILITFGATEEILAPATEYTSVLIWYVSVFMLSAVASNIVRAEGNPMLASVVQIISGVTNCILDPIFIFGWWGVPAMGIYGAAITTAMSWGVGLLVYAGYFVTGRSSYRFKLSYFIPDWQIVKDIYRVGVSQIVQMTAGSFVMTITNRVAGEFGIMALAILGVLIRANGFAFMPCLGIAQGAMPLIAYNYGARRKDRIGEIVMKAALSGFVWGMLCFIFAMFFPAQLLSIFNNDPEFISQGIQAVRMFSLGYFLVGMQMTVSVFFQGIGEGISSIFLASARQIVFLLPAIYFLPRLFGYNGVWYAFPAADILSAVVTLIWASIRFKQIGIPVRLWYGRTIPAAEPAGDGNDG